LEALPVHETIRLGRLQITFLKTAPEMYDALDLFEVTVPPEASSLLPHLHVDYDEIVFGMNGVVRWTIGGKEIPVGRGDKVSIPRGTPHFFINEESVPARFMLLHTPGLIIPQYFRDLANCFDKQGTPNLDCAVAVMMKYGATPLLHGQTATSVLH
jgi:mannose-6-phosphate isomerase-like protein (cupin superfamily)